MDTSRNISKTPPSTKFEFERTKSVIECFRCGVCCIKYQVRLDETDACRIADYLALTSDAFSEKCLDPRWLGPGSLLRQVDGACVFLDRSPGVKLNNCRIQAVKPQPCLGWMPGLDRSECREGLIRHWQLAVNGSGQLEGSAERLSDLQSFLQSLR